MSKLLYTQGNLFTGYPYAVEVVKQFGTTELHGPFSSETRGMELRHGPRSEERRHGPLPDREDRDSALPHHRNARRGA